MAAPSASIMQRLETLYGQAYDKLNSALGVSINTLGSAKQYANDAKNVVRGGYDREFGVNLSTDFVAGPLSAATYSLYVAPGTAYFGGVSKAITATTTVIIGNTDVNGNALISPTTGIPFLVSLVDGATPTFRVDKNYQVAINTATTIPVNSLPIPTYINNAIPLYAGVVPTTGISATMISDIRPVVYFQPLNNDTLVKNAFYGLDTTENTLIAKSFKDDFKSGVSGLVSAVTAEQTLDFKSYWKSQDYSFTAQFKKLYYDIYGTDLYTKIVSASPTQSGNISTYYPNNILNGVSNLSAKIETVPSTFSATTTVEIYGIKPSYSRLTSAMTAAQTGYFSCDINGFASYSYAAVLNTNNTFDVMSITPSTNGSLTVASHFVPNNAVAHSIWDKVYPVELARIYVPSTISANGVVSVGSSTSQYLGVGWVNIPSYACATCRVLVYNN